MKHIFTLLSLIPLHPVFGQDFHLKYWFTGLGSNAVWFMSEDHKDCAAGLKVEITGNVLTYSECEKTGQYKIDSVFRDTIWTMKRNFYKLNFRKSSIDSIISMLDTLKGKYVYCSNPHILSGGIFNYYIESEGWCSQFLLKNTYDSTALRITCLINAYLDKPYQIPVPDWSWRSNQYLKPLINNCPKEGTGSYREVLEQEYELLRKK